MYQEDKLRRAMYASGFSPRQVSKEIKMPERTFYRKMRRGTWGLDEVKDIARVCSMTSKQTVDIFLT